MECHAGTLHGRHLSLSAVVVATTPSAAHHHLTAVRRDLEVDGDHLHYTLSMGAVGQPLQVHLEATLRREADTAAGR